MSEDTLDLDALLNEPLNDDELSSLGGLAAVEEPPEEQLIVPGRKRMSVSAYRDYRKCPRYYKLKRVDKHQEEKKHYLAAGNVGHNAFYMAYGFPAEEYDEASDRMKMKWQVTGDFRPHDAMLMYELLYWRHIDEDGNRVLDDGMEIPEHMSRAFSLLNEDTPVVDNFVRGRKKALKSDSQEELREGWHIHFKEMLEKSLKAPLPYPVVDIEREVWFVLGGTQMVAYIDLVLDGSDAHGEGSEVFVDLKTGQTKPGANELFLDDQVATYYYAGGEQVHDFFMYYMNSGSLLAVDKNDALIQTLPEMAEQDSINIQNEHFPRAYEKQKCSWCPFRKECFGG